MWPFANKKEVIDFTRKEDYTPRKSTTTSTVGYDDLTKINNAAIPTSLNSSTEVQIPESSFDFSSMANVGTENLKKEDELSMKHLGVKIEDIEYKIDSLRSQINKIFDRLDLAEKKIDRGNRRNEF